MHNPKPVVIPPKSAAIQQLVPIDPKAPKHWAFSFRYWKQIDHFGCDRVQDSWFVSLLEKLRELCANRIDDLLASASQRDYWRYHPINWMQKNIPIKKSDLTWVDTVYAGNAEEYPLCQFQISKALGRVVGFFDECNVFNIVLLDPLHNLQPSKQFDYRVRPASPLACQYSSLLHDIERVQGKQCTGTECPVGAELKRIPSEEHDYNVVILRVPEDLNDRVEKAIATSGIDGYNTILEYGLEHIRTVGGLEF